MKKARRRSIQGEIFRSSMIFSMIILAIFGVFFSKVIYETEMAKANGMIKQRNYAINVFIDGYFSEIKKAIRVLAANEEIKNIPLLDSIKHQNVLDTYKTFAKANKNITYIYSAYSNGQLLINDYTPPDKYDPVARPWYQSSLAAMPDISLGVPYQDIKDKKWLISTGIAFPGKREGDHGVVVIDSSIQVIADLLKEKGQGYESSYSFVANQKHEVIIHHNQLHLNQPITEIIKAPVSLSNKEGVFNYNLEGVEKNAYYSFIEETGWIVFTVVEKREIVNPIIWQTLFYLLMIGILAVLIGIAQSALLSRNFSAPLIALQKRIKTITSGKQYTVTDYPYPNNEIGTIAREVGQLTEQELYQRTKELGESNQKLNQTIAELKALRGVLPICSSCKQIRDDKGSWNQLESYIEKHSEVQFSHGVCPDCTKRLYPEQYEKMKKKGML